ncbi:MAG TPA: Lsr2 family protein [Mycobacteriales bacterium]|nr:Lsr2 family protein [Mycobacteriales bacterium]
MAQRFQVLLVCDLHGDDTAGVETIRFGVDGTGYEIDVCEQHAGKLRDAFAPYVAAGRRAGRGGAAARGRRRGARGSAGVDPAAVRAWARDHKIKVSERGRISADVLARYTAAKK